jgi:hypothetical protein
VAIQQLGLLQLTFHAGRSWTRASVMLSSLVHGSSYFRQVVPRPWRMSMEQLSTNANHHQNGLKWIPYLPDPDRRC